MNFTDLVTVWMFHILQLLTISYHDTWKHLCRIHNIYHNNNKQNCTEVLRQTCKNVPFSFKLISSILISTILSRISPSPSTVTDVLITNWIKPKNPIKMKHLLLEQSHAPDGTSRHKLPWSYRQRNRPSRPVQGQRSRWGCRMKSHCRCWGLRVRRSRELWLHREGICSALSLWWKRLEG